MKRDVIIACDFSTKEDLFEFLEKMGGLRPYLKIGMELFYAEGRSLIEKLKEDGFKIFLDLKLHDIPNTVKKSMSVLKELEVDMINIHACGTSTMMMAAREELDKATNPPLLIAVTQLTSTSEEIMNSEILIDRPLKDVVVEYSKNAKRCGLDGVVCSPLEAGMVHEHVGESFLTVTPGIRFSEDDAGDQKRITTPSIAKELGSDFIVVGRSITASVDPKSTYERCVKDFL